MEILSAGHSQLLVADVGELNITVCGNRGWTDDGWAAHLENSAIITQRSNAKAVFIYAPASSPTAKQRQMSKLYEDKLNMKTVTRISLITDNSVVRGVMVAIGWLSLQQGSIKPFKSADYMNGFAWVAQAAAFDLEVARETLFAMVERAELVRPG